ncbi:MAG: hypothetical protein ABSG67_02570 [Thermoguttaceae bacterium]
MFKELLRTWPVAAINGMLLPTLADLRRGVRENLSGNAEYGN